MGLSGLWFGRQGHGVPERHEGQQQAVPGPGATAQRETASSLGEPFGLGGPRTCQFGKNQLSLALESELLDVWTW